jgi:hypothetical protein
MSPAKTALCCLIVAASIGYVPALAAPQAQGAPGGLASGPVTAMQKSEDPPKRLDSVALRQDAPLAPPGVAQPGSDGQKEQWLRQPEGSTSPEPGLWALLLAGFLGICALARPRIFSS